MVLPRKAIYRSLLREVLRAEDLSSEKAESEYLQSLKPFVKKLRSAYKRDTINIDYADKGIQSAYLLAYFPHYTDMIFKIFQQHGDAIGIPSHLSLFGGGPCPEVIGLLRYIDVITPPYSSLAVKAYDINHEAWGWSRNIIKNVICSTEYEFSRRVPIQLESEPFNFSEILPPAEPEPDFLVFQNCLNEIPAASQATFVDNFVNRYKSLPNGSWMCLINSGTVTNNDRAVDKLVDDIASRIHPLKINRDDSNRSSFGENTVPVAITDHLLTTLPGLPGTPGDLSLLPKRNLPFRYALFKCGNS